jgi:hypothetical protein
MLFSHLPRHPKSKINLSALTVIAVGSAALILQTACSPLKSQSFPVGAGIGDKPDKAQGQFYFLPKAKITVTGVRTKEGDFVVTVAKTSVPDREARYFLAHETNAMYKDEITLSVNSDGLLQGTQKANSTDELPTTIVALANTAASMAKISAGGGLGGLGILRTAEEEPKPPYPFKPFKISFFPEDDLDKVSKDLKGTGFKLVAVSGNASFGDSKSGAGHKDTGKGVYYRPLTTFKFGLEALADYEATWNEKFTVGVPSPHEIVLFPTKRLSFATMQQDSSFDQGELRSVNVVRPSPVLGLISIPKDVLGSIAGAVGEIFGNREKARKDSQESALAGLQLETARLKALKEQSEYQQAIGTSDLRTEAALLELAEKIAKLEDSIRLLRPDPNPARIEEGIVPEANKGGQADEAEQPAENKQADEEVQPSAEDKDAKPDE